MAPGFPLPAVTWVGVGINPSRGHLAGGVHVGALSSSIKTGAGVWGGSALISVDPTEEASTYVSTRPAVL